MSAYSKKLILVFFFLILSAAQALASTPDFNNPNTWNLYIGSIVNKEHKIILMKNKETKKDWNAIIILNELWALTDYQGKTIHFFTSTLMNNVARFAPNFYVKKNNIKYRVWWAEKSEPNTPKYLFFHPDVNGLIKGTIYIPPVSATGKYNFYLQSSKDNKIIQVSETSAPVNLKELALGLATDWQHDIPGSYPNFDGAYGSTLFQRFYAGLTPVEEIILED
ncbi:MAG: hypothetical protein KKA19_05685, partial [Candidatus Margulisbacteria bacterium]|nr:hypothetical protein [Candidatus Margulisiibacteriota bacterium]